MMALDFTVKDIIHQIAAKFVHAFLPGAKKPGGLLPVRFYIEGDGMMKRCFNLAVSTGVVLMLAGCPQPGVGDPFVPVRNITGVPGTATAGTPLALTGTLEPANTTNTVITWSVTDPGNTGAAVRGNIFTAAAAGTAIVTAAVVNGAVSGDYIQDFIIMVNGGGLGNDTVVTGFSLDNNVTAPVRDAEPDTGPIDTVQYTGTLAWQTADGAAHSGAFAASTMYRAVLTLTAKVGYTFSGVGANSFSYTGAAVTNATNSGTVTITFPATAAPGEDTVVNAFSLDGKVTAPVRDSQPDTGPIDTAQYTGTLVWQTADGAAHSGAFAASTVYRAELTLTAKPGYTFNGVGPNSFSYTGATSVTSAANSGAVTIVFPATEASVIDTVVNAFSLDGKVTAPVRDAEPDTGPIDTAQYTGTLVWQTADGAANSGAFAASTVYRAVLTLAAKTGYTFSGVGADSFSYSGAASVTNAANSGTVTITFPATAAPGGSAGISVSFTGPVNNDVTIDGGFKLSKTDSIYSSITISVGNAEDYNVFRWLVDGVALAGKTGGSVILNASDYTIGTYWLTVIAEKVGVPYSREFSFVVAD
jgi:hypothetical protein